MRLSPQGLWLLLGTLAALVLVDAPELGSDPWRFRHGPIHPHGLLGPLVRAAGSRWDLGFVRTPAVLAGLVLAILAAAVPFLPRWRPWWAVALAAAVVAALILPATLLQLGLRDSTRSWLYDNDSTYQIEIAGHLIDHGHDPYGYDYRRTGLARWYPATIGVDPRQRQVALDHLAYFPGTPLLAAAWNVLPAPLDDFRLLVALSSVGLLVAALAFPGPLGWRLAFGVALAGNPLVVRAAWFGTADAPSLLALVLAFALLLRSRFAAAAALLATAVLLKQFALAAVPFFAVLALRRAPRQRLRPAAGAFTAVLAAGFLPFLVAGPGALWDDTVRYGASTYRIVGYGLSHLLLKAGIIGGEFGSYPFLWLALLLWLPLTVWLVWRQLRTSAEWPHLVAFAISIFVLLFLGRVFQTSYLVWPLAAMALAGLVAAAEGALPPLGRANEDGRPVAVPVRRDDEL